MDKKVQRDQSIDVNSLFKTSGEDSTTNEKETVKEVSNDKVEKTPLQKMLDTSSNTKSGVVVDKLIDNDTAPKKNKTMSDLEEGTTAWLAEADITNKKLLLARKDGLIKDVPQRNEDLPRFMEEIDKLEIYTGKDGEEHVRVPKSIKKDKGDKILEAQFNRAFDADHQEQFISDKDDRETVQERIKKNIVEQKKEEEVSNTSNDSNNNNTEDGVVKLVEAPSEEELKKLEERNNTIQIIINKTVGPTETRTLEFTDDEKAVMSKATIINFNEILDKDLSSIGLDDMADASEQDKSFDDMMLDGFLEMSEGPLSPVVFACSGFRAYMKALSAGEIIDYALQQDTIVTDDIIRNLHTIYKNMVRPSIPIPDFAVFLHKFAFADMDIATWGMLLSTYEAEKQISMSCGVKSCGKSYTISYNMRTLLDYEQMSDTYLNRMKEIITSDLIMTDDIAKESPVNHIKRVRMVNNTNLIVDFGLRSAADMVYDTLNIVQMDEQALHESFPYMESQVCKVFIAFLPYIKAVHVKSTTGKYAHFTKTIDIAKALYHIGKPGDIELISSVAGKYVSEYDCVRFMLPPSECPHCHNKSGKSEVGIDFLASLVASEYETTSLTLENIQV